MNHHDIEEIASRIGIGDLLMMLLRSVLNNGRMSVARCSAGIVNDAVTSVSRVLVVSPQRSASGPVLSTDVEYRTGTAGHGSEARM